MGSLLPFLSSAPGPTARTLASLSFSTEDSGRRMPEAVLVSALTRCTRTRSSSGARARMERMEVAFVSSAVFVGCQWKAGKASRPGAGLPSGRLQ